MVQGELALPQILVHRSEILSTAAAVGWFASHGRPETLNPLNPKPNNPELCTEKSETRQRRAAKEGQWNEHREFEVLETGMLSSFYRSLQGFVLVLTCVYRLEIGSYGLFGQVWV